MKPLILCGPTGTGKNTVGEIIAQKRERCALIDFDVLRNMFIRPHLTPWDGESGRRQNQLGVDHCCKLGRSFIKNGYDCVILDVLSDETAGLYRKLLGELNPSIVQLLPTFEEIIRRNGMRPPRLTSRELEMVYEGQTKFSQFDHRLDNSQLSAEETAAHILDLMA